MVLVNRDKRFLYENGLRIGNQYLTTQNSMLDFNVGFLRSIDSYPLKFHLFVYKCFIFYAHFLQKFILCCWAEVIIFKLYTQFLHCCFNVHAQFPESSKELKNILIQNSQEVYDSKIVRKPEKFQY